MYTDSEQNQLKDRIIELTGMNVTGKLQIVTDSTEFMNIHRGQVFSIGGREFFIRGDVHEPRFGLQDQPKYWIKRAVDLKTGEDKILKLVFHEEFVAQVGKMAVRCYRSPEKEAQVLDRVRGDERFMQGYTLKDVRGNAVRIVDFIKGSSLYEYIMNSEASHERYFHDYLP